MPDAAVKTIGRYTLKIVYDEEAVNPREDYDNFGKMVCWHSHYNLGDKHEHDNPDDFLTALVSESIPDKPLVASAKAGQLDGFKLVYNRSTREWELSNYDDYFKAWFSAVTVPAPLEREIGYLAECIRDNLSSKGLMALAESKHLILPLYLFDHSGLAISVYDFRDKWDSGQVGWTYASHVDIIKEFGDTSQENMEKAKHLLISEVKAYDYYLHGECYGFQLFKDGKEQDSCWGFLGSFNDALASIREHLPEEAVPLADGARYGDDDTEYSPAGESAADDDDREAN